MIRLCLDTSAFTRLMRGQPNLQERLEAADEILLPVTVLGEVMPDSREEAGWRKISHCSPPSAASQAW